jgi:hypothetical protein
VGENGRGEKNGDSKQNDNRTDGEGNSRDAEENCKGNLTDLRRILHSREIQSKYINPGRTNTQHLLSQGKSKENALRTPG